MNLVYHIFTKLKTWSQDPFNRIFILILLFGILLRFYQLEGFVTFLGDQGRDAIILKRIVTFEHFPAIGAPSSVGQVFLGPFYYYFIAPWLFFSGFNPIGPAIGVAFFSSIFLVIAYVAITELFNKKVALVSVFLLAFSEVLINFSRFSWNPNLLPLASFLLFYVLVKGLKDHDMKKFVISWALFSISIQLHYVSLALTMPIVLVLIHYLYVNRKRTSKNLIPIFAMGVSFFILSLPLLVFDLRHSFLNSKNFITLFTDSKSIAGSGFQEIFNTFTALNVFAFRQNFHAFFSLLLLILLILSMIFTWKQKRQLSLLILFFLIGLLITSFYTGRKIPHYFGALYSYYYIIIAYFVTQIFWNKKLGIFLVMFLIGFIFMNIQGYSFLFNHPNNQIQKAQEVARLIDQNISINRYQVTSLPHQYSDSTYRYFLEIWKKRPIEKDSLEKAEELFVVCEDECTPIGDPQWDIAYFAPREIIGTWDVANVKLYKLIR